MCLYPKLIKNRRYVPNKKNGGVPPQCPDERLLFVTAACGKCMECRKQIQRQWLVRMSIQKNIGKNTIGDNKKMEVDLRTYNRSTHNLSTIIRNTQSVGTLVPTLTLDSLS